MPDAISLDQDEVLWLLAKAIDQRQLIDGLKIVRQWMDRAADRIAELEADIADMTEARDALAVQFEFAKAELWCFDDRIMYASVMDSYERLGAKVKELCAALAEREPEHKAWEAIRANKWTVQHNREPGLGWEVAIDQDHGGWTTLADGWDDPVDAVLAAKAMEEKPDA